MSFEDDNDDDDLMHLEVGELVILRDGRRGVIEDITLDTKKLNYTIRLRDGSQTVADVDGLLRARVYAGWVAPGTGWEGDERRTRERRSANRAVAGRRRP